MTFIPLPRGKVSEENTELKLQDGANCSTYSLIDGPAGSALPGSASFTATQASLPAGFSTTPNAYVGSVIAVQCNPTVDNLRLISAYDETTGVVTASVPWSFIPADGEYLSILRSSGSLPAQSALVSKFQIKLPATFSPTDGFYTGATLRLLSGPGAGVLNTISEYDGATRVAVCEEAWHDLPNAGALVVVPFESGVSVGAGGASTLPADAATLSASARKPLLCVRLLSGAGQGQLRFIAGVDASAVITLTEPWDTPPDAGSRYLVFGGWGGGSFVRVLNSTSFAVTFADTSSARFGLLTTTQAPSPDGACGLVSETNLGSRSPQNTHMETVTSVYLRVVLVGLGFPLSGCLQTTLSTFKAAVQSHVVESKVDDDSDCHLVRSVLAARHDDGTYENLGVDFDRSLHVSVRDPTTAFGELLAVPSTPIAQLKYTYGIPPQAVSLHRDPATSFRVDQLGSGASQLVQRVLLPSAASFPPGVVPGPYFSVTSAAPTATYHVWYSLDGQSTLPAPLPPGTPVQVLISTGDTPSAVAAATAAALGGLPGTPFVATTASGNELLVTNSAPGDVVSAVDGSMPALSESTAAVALGSSLCRLQTGESVGAYSVLQTRRRLRYRSGQGSMARFTAVFGEPVPGTRQMAGLCNSASSAMVGYDGETLVVSLSTGGRPVVATLTVVAAGPAGDALLTLDGLTVAVGVTQTGSSELLAAEIAGQDFSMYGYEAEAAGDTVIFHTPVFTGGSLPFAFSPGSSGCTGVFGSILAPAVPAAVTNVPQDSWNIDRLNGLGPSGMELNPQRGNVFEISFQYLGFGQQTFSVENPRNGRLMPFHVVRYANSSPAPSFSNPDMMATFSVHSSGVVAPAHLDTCSAALFVQGIPAYLEPKFTTTHTHLNVDSARQRAVLLRIRNPRVFRGLSSQCELLLQSLMLGSSKSANGTKALIRLSLVVGGVPSTLDAFRYVSKDSSVALVSQPAVGSMTLAGGDSIYQVSVPAEGSVTIDLLPQHVVLAGSQTLSLIYTLEDPTGTGNVDITSSLDWVEDQ